MNISKKRLLACCAVLLSVIGGRAATADGITFLFQNGTTASFAFSSNPVVDTSGDEIVVTLSSGNSVSYAFSSVNKFYFQSNVVEGIVQAESSCTQAAPVFRCNNGAVSVTGLSANESVRLQSVSGAVLASVKADGEGKAVVNFVALPCGAYVISTQGGVSFKFVKK